MYIKEWERLKNGLLEDFKDYIGQVEYNGRLFQTIPNICDIEYVDNIGKCFQYDDSDYNMNAQMGFKTLVSDALYVEYCKENIGDILGKWGYALVEPMPFCFSCDDGPIILSVTFKRIIDMKEVTYALDKDED